MRSSSNAFLVLVLFVAGAGSYIGGKLESATTPTPLQLHASTAAKKGNVSVSTGLINSDAGGFYSLDHDTGELQCRMIDSRSGKKIGTFRSNVNEDMQFDKIGERSYLMLVSYLLPNKSKSLEARLGDSTCFIVETISGRVIGYHVSYDKRRQLSGRNQDGKLKIGSSFLLRSKTREK